MARTVDPGEKDMVQKLLHKHLANEALTKEMRALAVELEVERSRTRFTQREKEVLLLEVEKLSEKLGASEALRRNTEMRVLQRLSETRRLSTSEKARCVLLLENERLRVKLHAEKVLRKEKETSALELKAKFTNTSADNKALEERLQFVTSDVEHLKDEKVALQKIIEMLWQTLQEKLPSLMSDLKQLEKDRHDLQESLQKLQQTMMDKENEWSEKEQRMMETIKNKTWRSRIARNLKFFGAKDRDQKLEE